ncbi:MAG: DMT family transporter [Deltaproteobacteria bacterium]|nr:MAG: DMT family transporter [Deltaproteobacteria bacterium]
MSGEPDEGRATRIWIGCVLCAALLALSVSAPLVRVARAPALAIVLWRLLFALPYFSAAAFLRRERWPLWRGGWAGLFLAFHLISWITAVQRTSIASATLLVTTGTLWSALLSRPLLGERVERRQWIGLVVAFLGIGIVVTGGGGGAHHLSGDLLALLGAFCWVGYVFSGRRARGESGFFAYVATVYLTAAVVTALVVAKMGTPWRGFDRVTWFACAALAFFPTLLGHGGLNYLLRFKGPVELGLWILSEPFLATLIGWIVLGEVPAFRVIAGGILTLLGIGLGISAPPPEPGGHETR